MVSGVFFACPYAKLLSLSFGIMTCADRRSEFLTALLTCVPRWVEKPPRSTPASIFNDLASIGDRMREIQAAEGLSAPGDEE